MKLSVKAYNLVANLGYGIPIGSSTVLSRWLEEHGWRLMRGQLGDAWIDMDRAQWLDPLMRECSGFYISTKDAVMLQMARAAVAFLVTRGWEFGGSCLRDRARDPQDHGVPTYVSEVCKIRWKDHKHLGRVQRGWTKIRRDIGRAVEEELGLR